MIPEIPKVKVFLNDTQVGILQQDVASGPCVFAYDRHWLTEGYSISPTELPLQEGLFYASPERFGGNFAVFEDSLPDGYGLYLLNRILRENSSSLREITPLQKLSIVGTSGMGALSYLPVMPGFEEQKEITAETDLDFFQEEALRVLGEKEPGDAGILYYSSANSGGARPKVAFRSGSGAHWLVKFRHEYDPKNIGKTELLYMKTAHECGVDIPRIGLLKDRYFCIERFDIAEDGKRRHVLTAAALLKTDFRSQTADYTNLLALTGYLTQDPLQVEEMFRRMVVNLVAINKDDHAKNFSFICNGGKWSLAPAYDITYSPGGSNGEHATSLFFSGNPSLELVLKAGTQIYIPEKRCMEIVREVEAVCRRNLPKVNLLTLS